MALPPRKISTSTRVLTGFFVVLVALVAATAYILVNVPGQESNTDALAGSSDSTSSALAEPSTPAEANYPSEVEIPQLKEPTPVAFTQLEDGSFEYSGTGDATFQVDKPGGLYSTARYELEYIQADFRDQLNTSWVFTSEAGDFLAGIEDKLTSSETDTGMLGTNLEYIMQLYDLDTIAPLQLTINTRGSWVLRVYPPES